ncbi:helicase-related protein [Clostridium tagluense]|uniref:helicase-related protein n=1 Tax=Clostridium tagluense TaxID=360422 RepID=UPI001CF48AC0|nr:C-terminal helicase domain-containing protein [Clostridium tagluense]MCB2300333.1 SWF/SNF helicase family protein [Clostridium tagluense]
MKRDPSIFIKDYVGGSAKMLAIDELIEESIAHGHRILLYSQFTSVLKLIRERFEKNNIEYMYLDGQTKVKDRPEIEEL